MTFLNFHLNACLICLICLDCQSIYGQDCICQAKVVVWKRKKVKRDYIVDFYHKPLTQKGTINQKHSLDLEFVNWIFANISSKIDFSLIPNNVNICQKCITMKYRVKKNDIINKQFTPNKLISVKEDCITVKDQIVVNKDCIIVKENCFDLTVDSTALESTVLSTPSSLPNDIQFMSKISKPDLQEILSRNLPKEWGKIELGLICYQKSSNPKADHFNLKSNDSIVAFVAEWRKNKKIQLCSR
ncbi:hypothetical protein RhiirA5_428231 [Rhizophagus irregularis]|uniref:Uncharacterized protein n=2 Tax=Rhizophagus irregularis TaxID=588596 RepID=A0A2N0P0Q2_9GLOM|nr:hypothetical protein GLOIN_2v1790548 [Rhizophagus irregularis DAOM 181602=DAOM 197198]PKC00409.1 hypothetical protein RhiirA5_428231 [Rhizophagus irregularis]POG58315.1 hypothetical protein GLOIN_2v1790548 [Rhizophagus irregularis DAOM 181602=DAOM 197198]UZO08793.1 hypothetical protein OCT59_029044 [Rhizophagus irregularis]GBC34456.2 hypothetical protein GLOIN_2v1790548 [Rhizophagus irregularis DAOM 181602=DAOM 197198]|eukprot:XP_025165181.1 hypothetical protein GLOIN_2v1790548 [Rhizophagus irregularis DAOM 181602=DAOM 197198]